MRTRCIAVDKGRWGRPGGCIGSVTAKPYIAASVRVSNYCGRLLGGGRWQAKTLTAPGRRGPSQSGAPCRQVGLPDPPPQRRCRSQSGRQVGLPDPPPQRRCRSQSGRQVGLPDPPPQRRCRSHSGRQVGLPDPPLQRGCPIQGPGRGSGSSLRRLSRRPAALQPRYQDSRCRTPRLEWSWQKPSRCYAILWSGPGGRLSNMECVSRSSRSRLHFTLGLPELARDLPGSNGGC